MKKSINEARSGDVVYVKRGLYKHYGVYDHGNVIEMSADRGKLSLFVKSNAYVRKVSLCDFLNGDPGYVDNSPGDYSRKETLKRAREEIGSGSGTYDPFNNNCEHKARKWQTGYKQSEQVDDFGSIVSGLSIGVLIGIGLSILSGDWD